MHKPDAPLATTPEMIAVFEAAQTDTYRSVKALDEQRMYEKKLLFAERYGIKAGLSNLPFDARTADGVFLDYKTSRQDGMSQFYRYVFGGRSSGKSAWLEHATKELQEKYGRALRLKAHGSYHGDKPVDRIESSFNFYADPEAFFATDQLAWMGQYGRPSTTQAYVYKTLQTILRGPERPIYRFCDAPYAVNYRIRELFEGLRTDTPPINYDAFVKRYTQNQDGLYSHQRKSLETVSTYKPAQWTTIPRGAGKA